MPDAAAEAQAQALMMERVTSLAESVLATYGAELVDLQVKRGRTQFVRLTVDREEGEEGIELGTCARISDELSRLMDADDPIPGRYTLEVTSPGADRPLKTARDFSRNTGRPVRVNTRDGREHEGALAEIEPERIRIEGKAGDEWIEIADVVIARVILPW